MDKPKNNNNRLISWILFTISFLIMGWGPAAVGIYFGYKHKEATGDTLPLYANSILVGVVIFLAISGLLY